MIQDDFFYYPWNFGFDIFLLRLDTEYSFTWSKSVLHSFLRIPQSAFPMVESTVLVESGRSEAKMIPDDFFYYPWNFGFDIFLLRLDSEYSFTLSKSVHNSFLRIPQSAFPMVE